MSLTEPNVANSNGSADDVLNQITKDVKTQETIQKWNKRYQEARTARLPFEKQWHVNLAFFFGRQWVSWDSAGTLNNLGKLVEPITPPNRVRLTINKIRPIIRKELAKLNKEQVRGFISPNTTDGADIAAARAGEKLMTYVTKRTKLARIMSRVDWWTLVCGTGFAKCYYDPNAPMAGSFGGPKIEAISPFHILVPNLDDPELENQAWIIHAVVRTPQQIKEMYGVEVPSEGFTANSTVDSRLLEAQGLSSQSMKREGVELKEAWIKPCPEHPQGALFVWAGDKQINYQESWPYVHGMFPFVRRQYIETGRFYGESTVTDLIPLQVEYNRTRSQIVENKNRMGRPQLLAQIGSIDTRRLRSEAGQVIEYRPGMQPPQPLPLAQLPNYIIEFVNSINNDMKEISSQQDLATSNVPPGVTSATAIAYIQENQDSVLSDTLRDKEMQWELLSRMMVSYCVQYWDAERTVKVTGTNQNFEAFTLSSGDLRDNTDWEVVIGSATPTSYSAKQAQIMELMKMGAIPVEKALDRLELGDTAGLFEEMETDVREADRENLKMSRGVYAAVNDWQNHHIHITQHDNYRKREEYDNVDQPVSILFRRHVLLHMINLVQGMGTQVPVPPQMLQDPNFIDPQLESILRQFIQEMAQGMPQGPLPQGWRGTTATPGVHGAPPNPAQAAQQQQQGQPGSAPTTGSGPAGGH